MKKEAAQSRWDGPEAVLDDWDDRDGRDDNAPTLQAIDGGKDHFVVRDGVRFAGTHLILDLWEADRLDDQDHIEQALRRIVEKAKATLLHIHLHRFTPNGGISGVAVLAESHISVHTWPEKSYAAFDVFMCGDAVPHVAVEELQAAFGPARLEVSEHRRGVLGEAEA
jgi:S-adenosylmethionine decarboxylase